MDAMILRDQEFNQRLREHILMKAAEPTVDWHARLAWWKDQVDDLLTAVRQWIAPAIDEGIIIMAVQPCPLSEEPLGEYLVGQCILGFGNDAVTITPKGTFVVGGTGRVDIEGPNGTAMLLLIPPVFPHSPVDARPAWSGSTWHLANAHTNRGLAPLDRDTFQWVVLDLLGTGE
jgi:hypothetical protein